MYVHTPTKSLILRVRDPLAIREIMPGESRTLALPDGHNLAVRWTLDSARLLRNIGIAAPSPITKFYDWPGRYKPMDQQVAMASFCTLYDKCFNLSEQRTGKTYATLWAIDYLMLEGKLKRALIMSTVSTMKPTWAEDIFSILPHRTCTVVHGANQDARLKNLNRMVDLYVLNHDGIDLEKVALALRRRPDIGLIVVDEASFFRNSEIDRYRFLAWVMEKKLKLWLLTGTPCPNGPWDAWALANLVNPAALGGLSFTRFRDEVGENVSASKWRAKRGGIERAFEVMQPAIRFEKRKVLQNLPPLVGPRDVHSTLSKEQLVEVKRMRAEMRMFAGTTEINAVNGADKVTKLRQILCGSVKDPQTGVYHDLPCHQRIRDLRLLIAEASAKVLVIAPFTGIVRLLGRELPKRDGDLPGYKTLVLNGDVTQAKRPAIIKAFKEDPAYPVMVCHPRITAHGHDFSVADTTIFFAPIYSNDDYTQVIERFSGMAQKNTMFLYHMLAHPTEASIYRVVHDRDVTQKSILELYREFINSEDDHL